MPQSLPTASPSLPLEILELIVSYHADPFLCPENGPHWFCWSSELLALHLTSREFRALALREIGKNVSISLGEPTKSNEKLRHLLLSSTPCPRLGTCAQYIKSLAIRVQDTGSTTTTQVPTFFEFDLLEYFCDHVAPQELHLDGGNYKFATASPINPVLHLDWNILPQDVHRQFKRLTRLPTLEELSFDAFENLPQDLFEGTFSEDVGLTKCTFVKSSPNVPRIVNDSIRKLRLLEADIPTCLSLPNLKFISSIDVSLASFNTMWTLVKEAQSTLESLEIYDRVDGSHTFPLTLRLTDLPKLEFYSYHHEQRYLGLEYPSVSIPQLDFLQGGYEAAGLEEFVLGYSIGGFLSVKEALLRTKDPFWSTIDSLLTSPRFGRLKRVTLNFTILVELNIEPLLVPGGPDLRAKVKRISDKVDQRLVAGFCASFPRLRGSSIDLVIKAQAHIARSLEKIIVAWEEMDDELLW